MNFIKQALKTNKTEIKKTIDNDLSIILKDNIILHSHSLYDTVKHSVYEQFKEHTVEYDVKRKIIRTIKLEYEYVSISTIAEIENRKRYFRRLDIKNSYIGYHIEKLHCTHTGIWIDKKYMKIFKKIIKKLDKKGNSIIHCFFPKDYINKNGDLGILAYIENLQKMFEGKVREYKKRLAKMEKAVQIAHDNWGSFQKLSTNLSTDFMGFIQLVHKTLYGYLIKNKTTAEAVVKHKNKFKIIKKSWKNDIKRVRFRDFINYLVLKPS